MLKSFHFFVMDPHGKKQFLHENPCIRIRISLSRHNEPYFSVWLKRSKATILDIYDERNLIIRDPHVIKLIGKDCEEWIGLLPVSCQPSHIAAVILICDLPRENVH